MNLTNKSNLLLTIISVIIFVFLSFIIINYFNISFKQNENKKKLIRKAVFEGLVKS